MISVVVLTKDEAANLPRCLGSVAWADDLLVLDSGSSDGTCEVARSLGARVMTRAFDAFGSQRNFAMEHGALRNDWVLHLDADEVVTPELRDALQRIVREGERAPFPADRIPSKVIHMGRWLRHAGMYPAYQVRFGRRERLRFVDHGHGQREALPVHDIGTIDAPFEHYNFSKGLNDWFARHLRYARAEAVQAIAERREALRPLELVSADPTVRRRALKRVGNRMPCRPTLRFWYSFALRRGFLDGAAGYRYARMLQTYQRFIDLNIAELEAGPGPGAAVE
jgi:glycosyltransferase involved in cell wall biosynthesis